jgi:8-oxo-dGTP diphosphatase
MMNCYSKYPEGSDDQVIELYYGTSNKAKILHMSEILKETKIRINGINDNIISPNEKGNTPLENARIKSTYYFSILKKPIFSCDSGLYINELNEENQPGVNIRRVNGKYLDDEEMIDYYSSLARRNGGRLTAYYKNAISMILSSNEIYELDDTSICSTPFIITSEAHKKRNHGFPLDSLSINIESNKYYYDVENENNVRNDKKIENGFQSIFIKFLKKEIA